MNNVFLSMNIFLRVSVFGLVHSGIRAEYYSILVRILLSFGPNTPVFWPEYS